MDFSCEKPFVRYALRRKLISFNHLCLIAKDSRLFYIISGSGRIIINDTSYNLLEDTIILFREATQYKWEGENIELYSLNFDYNSNYSNISQSFEPLLANTFNDASAFDCGYIEDFPQLNHPIVIHNAASLKNCIKNIITEHKRSDNYSQYFVPILTQELIFNILRIYENRYFNKGNNTSSTRKVKEIINYIYAHYSEEITNQTIAQKFNFSPSHLGRIFKKCTNHSIHNFILQHRIQIAKELLATTELSIGEISRRVGYNYIYHFSKIFKKTTGLSPSQYKVSVTSNQLK